MHLIFLLLLSYIPARAQNVTASFNTSIFGENPAATATRTFGIVTPMVSMTNSAQSIEAEKDPNVINEWKRDIAIQRYEFLLAGRGKKNFVPELYLAQNKANIKIKAEDSEEASENNVSLFNSSLNLGYHVSDRIKLGLNVFKLQLEYQKEGTYASSPSDVTSYQADSKLNDLGIGLGTTIFITEGLAFGAFFSQITEASDYTYITEVAGTPTTESGTQSYTHTKSGIGFSYQVGSSRNKGFRIEVSHSKMQFGDSNMYGESTADNAFTDAQNRIAIEATTMGLTGGISFTRVYGRYINYIYFLDSVISEFPSYDKPLDVWGGFLGFKSARGGSSIGGYAFYYNGSSEMKFLGLQSSAKVSEYSLGLNYAYSF